MKKLHVLGVCIIIALVLTGGVNAGRVTSSAGGVASSHSGGGYGSAVKGGSAGHSAAAEVIYTDTLVTDGSFDVTTFGDDHETDGMVTVDAKATNLEVTGELDEGIVAGSSVTATAHVRADGDETLALDGIWVNTLVESTVILALQPDSTGEASAKASGTATGQGNLAGVGEVRSESKGSTEVAAEGGDLFNPSVVTAVSQIAGRAELENNGLILTVVNGINSGANAGNMGKAEGAASGSGKSSAESTQLVGATSVKGSAGTALDQDGGGGGNIAQVLAVQIHDFTTDVQMSMVSVGTFGSATVPAGFSGKSEAIADASAESSGGDLIGPGISVTDNQADGSAGNEFEVDDGATATVSSGVGSSTVLALADGLFSGYSSLNGGPAQFNNPFAILFGGRMLDSSGVSVNLQMNAFPGGSAEASSYVDGDASSDSSWGLLSASTDTDGSAGAEGEVTGPAALMESAYVGSTNFLDGTAADLTAGTFDTNAMSVSTVGGSIMSFAAGGFAGAGFEAGGDTGAEATFQDPAVLAETGSMADGSVYGEGGPLVIAEITGIAIAGDNSASRFIDLGIIVTGTDRFTSADSGLIVNGYMPAGLALGNTGKMEAGASGKAGADADLTAPARAMESEASAAGKLALKSSFTDTESFSRALVRSADRSFYDLVGGRGYTSAIAEDYGIAEGNGLAVDAKSSQTASFSGAKTSAEGTYADLGTGWSISSDVSTAGSAKDTATTRDAVLAVASSRIYANAETFHNNPLGGADRAYLDIYYQGYTAATDESSTTALAQLSGVKISGNSEISDGTAEEASFSLKGGSAKIQLKPSSNSVKLAFPVKHAKISGEPDPGYGYLEETQTQNSATAVPDNFAWGYYATRVNTNTAVPAVPVPPQP